MIHIAITNDIAFLGCRLLIQLIQYCKAVPVLIPCFLTMQPGMPKTVALQEHCARVHTLLSTCQAIIIPGNRFDVDPRVYGEHEIHPETEMLSDSDPYNVRFETELLMARYALDNTIPFIGICGGMHMFNVLMGGTLTQHLPDTYRIAGGHHYDSSWHAILSAAQPQWEWHFIKHLTTHNPPALAFTDSHNLIVEPYSVLGRLYRERGARLDAVSELSMHHQGCTEQQLSGSFEPIAWAPDGIVEAAQLKGYTTLGLVTQFHWEYNVGGIAVSLMNSLIDAAQQ